MDSSTLSESTSPDTSRLHNSNRKIIKGISYKHVKPKDEVTGYMRLKEAKENYQQKIMNSHRKQSQNEKNNSFENVEFIPRIVNGGFQIPLTSLPRDGSLHTSTISNSPENTGKEHILYRRKTKFKPSQVDESFFGVKDGHSPIWEQSDETEINKIENEYKKSMMLDYIIPKETDIWRLEGKNGVIKNHEVSSLPVKRVRTPIKARHGVQNMDIIAGRDREILAGRDRDIYLGRSQRAIGQEEMIGEDKTLTLNSPSLTGHNYKDTNERGEEYIASRILNNSHNHERSPLEKMTKNVKIAAMAIPKLISLKRGIKEPRDEIEESIGKVLSKQATERRETEEDSEIMQMYALLSERQNKKKKGRRSLSPKEIDEIIAAESGQDSGRSRGGKRDVEKGEDLLDDVVLDPKSDAMYVYEHNEFLKHKEKELRKRRELQQRNFRKIIDTLNQTGTDSEKEEEERSERPSRFLMPIKKQMNSNSKNDGHMRSLSAFDPITLDEKYNYLPPLQGTKVEDDDKLRSEMRTFIKAFEKAANNKPVKRYVKSNLRGSSVKPPVKVSKPSAKVMKSSVKVIVAAKQFIPAPKKVVIKG